MLGLARAGRRLVLGTVILWLTFIFPGYTWDDVDGPAVGDPESIGRYAAGCAIGAARLPPDGIGCLLYTSPSPRD